MLSKAERQWAINTKMRMSHKDGFRCGKCGVQCYFLYVPCPLIVRKEDKDWEIEFQSRVAAKLAENTDVSIKAICQAGIHGKSIAWANLKIARLQVEEEMDANGT